MDSDDLMNNDPNLLSNGSYYDQAIDALEKDDDTFCVYCNNIKFDQISHSFGTLQIMNEKRVLSQGGPMTYMIARREDILKTNRFDENLTHNEDLSLIHI